MRPEEVPGLRAHAVPRIPDVRAFSIRLERVLAALLAHLEEEKQAILPLLAG